MAGTLTAATIDSGAAGTPPTFSANGTQIGTLCRAWVNFDGTLTGTNVPRTSYNVSNVTRNAVGDYTVNFTNALSDANYSFSFGGKSTSYQIYYVTSISASSIRFTTGYASSTAGNLAGQDASSMTATFFR